MIFYCPKALIKDLIINDTSWPETTWSSLIDFIFISSESWSWAFVCLLNTADVYWLYLPWDVLMDLVFSSWETSYSCQLIVVGISKESSSHWKENFQVSTFSIRSFFVNIASHPKKSHYLLLSIFLLVLDHDSCLPRHQHAF